MAYEQGGGMSIWLNPAQQLKSQFSTASGGASAVGPSFKAKKDLTDSVMGFADTMYQKGKNKAIGTPIGIDELTGATIYEAHPQADMYGYSPLPPNSVYEKDLKIYHERFNYNLEKKKEKELQAKILAEKAEAEKLAQNSEPFDQDGLNSNGRSISDLADLTATQIETLYPKYQDKVNLLKLIGDPGNSLYSGGSKDNSLGWFSRLVDTIDDSVGAQMGTWLDNWNVKPEFLMSGIERAIENVDDSAELFRTSGSFDDYFKDGKHQDEYKSILGKDGDLDNDLYNKWFRSKRGEHVLRPTRSWGENIARNIGDYDKSFFKPERKKSYYSN